MTYKFLILTMVRKAIIGLASLIEDLESNNRLGRVIELATDETLSIEDTSTRK